MTGIEILRRDVVSCTLCPRLVQWRTEIAQVKTKRFHAQQYWGKPVPGFGDPNARLLLVGLAPAGHGANRTGRMFTGDRSGDWLYKALFAFGFANQASSESRNDRMKLTDCYITAACRCAPPANKPLLEEIANCRPFLLRELRLLPGLRVVIGLGKIGFDVAARTLHAHAGIREQRYPHFRHGAEYAVGTRLTLLGSFHPSQQNTFTGRLTEKMFHAVFQRARAILKKG